MWVLDIRRILFVVAVVVTVFSVLGGVAVAHHVRAAYSREDVTMEGTVTDFIWRNPRAQVVFEVKDADGEVVEWRGEYSSVTSMMAAGMTRNTFKPGDVIRFEARVATSGAPYAVLGAAWRADGTLIVQGDYTDLTRGN
jgi:hypothetical protein